MVITYKQAKLTCCAGKLDKWIEQHCPGATELDADEVVRLTMLSTPDWKGEVALYAPEISAEQRIMLVRASGSDFWKGFLAVSSGDLTTEQRLALASEVDPEYRGWVACRAPGLTMEQRVDLLRTSSQTWRCHAVWYYDMVLTKNQKQELLPRELTDS